MEGKERKPLQVVIENGEPSAATLYIEECREMLEWLEGLDDLETLNEMRKKPLKFQELEEFLYEQRIQNLR